MTCTDEAATQYRGFEVVTSLVSFSASGWTIRYRIAAGKRVSDCGEIVRRGEVHVSTDRVERARAAARAVAYRWIDGESIKT